MGLLLLFFLVVPGLMLWVGATTQHCGDPFSAWLLAGGALCYIDLLVLLAKARYC